MRKILLNIIRNKAGDLKEKLFVYNDGYIQYSYESSKVYSKKEPQLLTKTNKQEVALIMKKLGQKIENLEEEKNYYKNIVKNILNIQGYDCSEEKILNKGYMDKLIEEIGSMF